MFLKQQACLSFLHIYIVNMFIFSRGKDEVVGWVNNMQDTSLSLTQEIML